MKFLKTFLQVIYILLGSAAMVVAPFFFLLPSGTWRIPFDSLRLACMRFLKCTGDIADRHNESPKRQKDKAQRSSGQEVFWLDIFDNEKRNLQGL